MSGIRVCTFTRFAGTAALATVLLILCSPYPARSLTSSQDLCVNTMNKSGSKVAKTQGKENSSCVKDFGSGKLTGTAQDCLTADRKNKISKATGKTVTLESKKCTGSPPAYGYTGSATTNQSAIDQEVALTTDVFGTPIDNALVSSSTDKAMATCQAVVVKAYEKYGSIYFKDFTICKKTELKDFPDSIQEISDCIGADFKGKFAKIRGKILTMIQKKCAGLDLQTAFPGVCQAQATSDTGLADCLADRVECRSCEAMVGIDGIPASIRPCDLLDNGALDASCGGCGNGVVEAPEECDDGGESITCDSDCTLAECGDGTLNPTAGEQCDDNNTNPDDGCTDSCTICGDGVVTPPEECDDGNLISGDGCSSACLCGPGSGEFGCQDPQCPNAGELTIFAGTGKECSTNADCDIGDGRLPAAEGAAWCDTSLVTPRCVSTTELDTGWTGIAHDSDVSDRAVTMGRLVCPGPAPTCGLCAVVGIDPTPRNCRCANDPRAICNEPFQADNDDCGGDVCECYFGPPIPLSSGNVPACAINRFAENVSGTANVDTGEGEITAKLATLVYLGDLIHTPCPYCSGDVTPGDGLRDGTCVLGDHDGLPCDVDAFNATFPADPAIPGNNGQGNTSNSGMSLDCWPPSGKNVSGSGLNLVLKQTTGTTSLPPASIPCGFIRKCSDEPRTFCATNGDCGGCASNADCGSNGVCDGSGRCSCEPGPTCRDDSNFSVRCEQFDNSMCKTCATNADCPGIAACESGHCGCLPKNQCSDDRTLLCWSNADCGGCTTNADCGPPLGGGICDGTGQCSCGPAISKCFCGLCSDDEAIACSSEAECGTCSTNADCPGSNNVAPGTCVGGRCSCERRNDNGDPLPNGCTGGVCEESPPGSGEGVCTLGPADNLCDGVVRANGDGFLQCLSNGDCSAAGFNGGNCTLTKQRECFLDPITATGVQDPNKPVSVAAFCIPRTSSDGINSVAGLPGPARVVNQASSRIFCASNPSVLYEPGVGGCP